MASTATGRAAQGDGTTPVRRGRLEKLSGRDRLVLLVMAGIPTAVLLVMVWAPALATILLSFTRWDGLGGVDQIRWIGLDNYRQIIDIYPPFWPAFWNNVRWLVFLLLVPTTFGLLMAYLLDREIRGSRFYQGALYLPVVLSLAVVGFIAQLFLSQDFGFVNEALGSVGVRQHDPIDWLGDDRINIWAVMAFAAWRHAGYIMVLYLAGLKSVDRSLREAAQIDGAGEWQTFRRVVFPSLRPINVVVLVVTVVEALRAFDLVYVINGGKNGLELLSVLVTDNIIGEASRVGYGSALGVILFTLCVGFIVIYVTQNLREREA